MKILFDFFPVLLFFVAYKLADLYVATAVAIAAAVAQVGYLWLKQRRVENMHLVTLALIVVLGGATLLLDNEAFIKWKPTAVNWLFAVVFLGSQVIGDKPLVQRVMEASVALPTPVWRRLNLVWALFFAALGVLDLYVAFYYGLELDPQTRTDIWVNFKVYGILGLTLAFVVAQALYLARHMQAAQEEEPR